MEPQETHQLDPAAAPAESESGPGQATGTSAGGAGSGPSMQTRHISPKPQAPPAGRVEGQLADGHLLQDRYRIMGLIGVGGMSAVYKAQDTRFRRVTRVCVVKEMLNSATDPEVRAMIKSNFDREANILATLGHAGIVQVFDYFTEGDRNYLVLEFIDGKDLEAVLTGTEGFLSEAQVVSWSVQVCEVLTYLHSREPQPVIFRDIKPSNIMLEKGNRIRLVDFGIARVFYSGQKGTMIGTEGYSPPEQYRGVAEPRVDVYAMGATMHHLLSKQDPRLEPPFSFHERPIHQRNPTISRELEDIVNRALEYDINKRYGSAEELRRALLTLSSARDLARTGVFTSRISAGSDVVPLWRFACEDEVRCTPAVQDGVVYAGSYDSNVYALAAADGKFMWKYATEGGIGSSPCAHLGRVFIGSSDRVVYAINADTGRIVWTCPTEDAVWSSPRAAFEHVFFGSDDWHLYAVNIHSGRLAWKFETEGKVRSSPAIGSDAIYVGSEGGMVYAIDIGGKLRWRFRARRGVTSSPVATDEMVYVGSQDWYLYGLDVRSGWAVWRHRTDGPITSSPALDEGLVFVGSSDGALHAVHAESGRLVWKYQAGDQISSSPAVAEGAVYFGSVDGGVYCLDAKTGDLRWRFQSDGPVASSPTVVDEVVYVGSADRYVYALTA
ncbi:MAG: serine/threonine-protein kinase [Anaerolineales bacterium]|nr:MAG: serine/threonine-protein kinase [Anaerolineales bacterium]